MALRRVGRYALLVLAAFVVLFPIYSAFVLSLQPAEIVKLTLPMFTAHVLALRWARVRRGDLTARARIRDAALRRFGEQGVHRTTVREIAGTRLRIGPMEALDGTPVVDIKPALDAREA